MPLSVFLTVWTFDPWAVGAIVVYGALYGWGLVAAARVGVRWPLWRVLVFYCVGLGSYAWICCSYLGVYSQDLRFAFVLRMALLLFLTPMMCALGQPLDLIRAAVQNPKRRIFLARVAKWPLKIFGNHVVAPVIGLLVFSAVLTPLSGIARLSPGIESALTILVPILGLLLVVPVGEVGRTTTSTMIMLQFVFAFIELLADAIPGIMLRLNAHIMDKAPALTGAHPLWFPNAMADQQLAGDWLWFLCEAADLPIMILMFMQFSRTDKGEGAVLDEMSDEEMDALNHAHLNRQI